MLKKALLAAAVLAAFAAPSLAVPITPTNLDTLALGVLVAGPSFDDFISPKGEDIGDLENTVYFNSSTGLYTYVHKVTPAVNNISEFNTGYYVRGFVAAGSVAGYSFSDAKAAGDPTPANAFEIERESDGTIDWSTNFFQSGSRGWDSGEPIRHFFQSLFAPNAEGDYNIIDSKVGTATSYAPAPEPSALLLMGTGLLGLRLLRRRK